MSEDTPVRSPTSVLSEIVVKNLLDLTSLKDMNVHILLPTIHLYIARQNTWRMDLKKRTISDRKNTVLYFA
jgi:hypothetical protein